MMQMVALFSRLFLVFAVALALAGASFAHRGMPSQIDDGMIAYVAAGGALADLCGDGDQGGPGAGACDACRLVDHTVMLRGGIGGLRASHALALEERSLPDAPRVQIVVDPTCPARAPPIV